MGLLEDHKIELAVQEALAASADSRALALVQIAVDPAGTKSRLEELTAATKSHDAARDRAEQALSDAEAAKAEAARNLAELAQRTSEFEGWKSRTEQELRQRDLDCRAGENANAQRAAELADQAGRLKTATAAHARAIDRLRAHVAEHDAAAARA